LKKFLSILLTMAMVMSLFTGTVLAAAGDNIKAITFSKDVVVDGVDTEVKVILEPNAGKTIGTNVTWTMYKGADVFDSGSASTVDSATAGYKEFYLNTSRLSVANGDVEQAYTLYVEDDAVGVDVSLSAWSTITARHPLSINGSTEIPVVKLNTNTQFAGVITGGKDLYVALLQGATVVASSQANASGEFTLSRTFTSADIYSIGLRKGAGGSFTPYLSIDFEPKEDMKITNTTVPVATRDDDAAAFDVIVTVEKLANADTLPNEKNIFVEMTKPNGDKVKMDIYGGAPTHEYTYKFAKDTIKSGTYSITAVAYNKDVSAYAKLSEIKLENGEVALRKAVGTFTVADNASNMVVTVTPGEKPAGAFTAGTGVTDGVFDEVIPTVSTSSQAVEVKISAPATKTISKVAYTVSGPIKSTIDRSSTYSASNTYYDSGTAGNVYTRVETFDITHGGTITVSGTITYVDKTTETFEKTVKVNGYVVEFDAYTLGQVGDEITLKAIVKTTSGTPVNNKKVVWTPSVPAFYHYHSTDKVYYSTLAAVGTTLIDGASTNIIDGTYSRNVKLGAYATGTVEVLSGTKVYAESTFVIYGDEVYTAEVTGELIATVANQKLTVAVYNVNGTKINPTTVQIDELGKNIVNETSFTNLGISDSKVTFNPITTGTFNLLLGTDQGSKMVVVPVTVIAPQISSVTVNSVESTTVTAGVREEVVITFENLTNGTIEFSNTNVLDSSLIPADTAIYTSATGANKLAAGGTITISNKVAKFYVDGLAKRDDTSTINVKAKADAAGASAVSVTKLTLSPIKMDTGTHQSLVVDANIDLYLTVTDARGKAMEGFTVSVSTGAGNLAGNNTAITDADGKAVLNVKPVSVGTVELAVGDSASTFDVLYELDKNDALVLTNSDVLVRLPVGRDVTGPVVNIEENYVTNSSTYTVSFSVTDTSKIAEVWVNNVKALVRPDNTVRYTLNDLDQGVNEIEVLAYDVEGNGTVATLVVEYLKPATVLLTIGSTDATKDGVAMTDMDQAPVTVNGRTFLPVRFVFENLLNGDIAWDESTQTITSIVRGSTIKMVIGSKTAYVNGETITLLEAPYIETSTQRTLVPMREIMEAIGISLSWNGATQTVTITIPQQ